MFLYPQCSAISAFERGSTQNARIASWVLSWVASWVFSCGPTFSTATGVSGMTVRNTSPSIALQSVAGEKNLGLYVSEYPGSFSVSLPIYLLDYLSAKLTDEFGKGFDKSNIRKMRQFYCTFPIRDTLCLELSWSHYHLLIRVADEQTRTFYVEECLRSVWSVRQLERQIGTMYYQRINKSNRVSGFSPIPCYSIS